MTRSAWCAFFGILFYLCLAFSAEAMEIVRVTPVPGSVIDDVKPTLYVYYSSSRNEKIQLEKIRLLLNDRNVTWKCLVMPTCISCSTEYRFPEGINKVAFLYEGSTPVRYEWTFTVAGREEAAGETKGELSHNASGKLQEDDALEVTLKSSPGGHARFSISDFKKDIPMAEESPGVYRGIYEVQPYDKARNADITAVLRTKDGQTYYFTCDRQVTLAAYFFRVRILSPQSDSTVGSYFDIIGKTRPHARVYIAPSTGFTGALSPGAAPGQNAIETVADEKGNFKVHYGFPIKIPGMNHRFMVTARDVDENISIPMTFYVKVK